MCLWCRNLFLCSQLMQEACFYDLLEKLWLCWTIFLKSIHSNQYSIVNIWTLQCNYKFILTPFKYSVNGMHATVTRHIKWTWRFILVCSTYTAFLTVSLWIYSCTKSVQILAVLYCLSWVCTAQTAYHLFCCKLQRKITLYAYNNSIYRQKRTMNFADHTHKTSSRQKWFLELNCSIF